MITIGQLADTAAIVLNRDHGTVTFFARSLRDEGLLPKHGRGPSAAKMDWLAGARLLTAFLVSDSPKHAAAAVRFFGSLPLSSIIREPGIGPDRLSLTSVFGLSNPHTFEEVLVFLLRAYVDPDLREVLDANGFEIAGERAYLPMLTVTIYDTSLGAEIFLSGTQYTYSDPEALNIVLGSKKVPKKSLKYNALLALPMSRGGEGIRTARTIAWPEIGPIAEAIAGRPIPSADEAHKLLEEARQERAELMREVDSPERRLRISQLGERIARLSVVIDHRRRSTSEGRSK